MGAPETDSRNNAGATPLKKAAFSDKESAFQLLIQNCADPFLKDNDGFSLLHKATQGGNTSIINKLLSLVLDVNSRSSTGVTPLMTAALGGKKGAFEMLLQRGADSSLKDSDGVCVLHFAAEGGDMFIINKLYHLVFKDLWGKTPLISEMNKNNSEAAKLSISREAEKSALDCEQSLFCSKICKREYLSSEVARVASA